jgi:large repetitive protein
MLPERRSDVRFTQQGVMMSVVLTRSVLVVLFFAMACSGGGSDESMGGEAGEGGGGAANYNPALAQCADQFDNDEDGLIDLDDPGCDNVLDDDEVQRQCADGIDNDEDELIDYPADPGCGSINDDDEQNPLPPPQCADGVDNDRDGDTDEEDIGCASVADTSEDDPDTVPECADSIDNNEDGAIDFPHDIGCSARGDDSEDAPRSPPACSNGRDDDEDGLIDYPLDPGCSGRGDRGEEDKSVTPECADGEDNDRDGLIDFGEDDGCSSASDASELGPCQTVYTPPRVFVDEAISIDTSRGVFESEGSCGGRGSPELVVLFRVEEPIDAFYIDTYIQGTQVPTTIYVRKQLCLSADAEVVCEREFANAPNPGQKVTVRNPELGDYFIFVDGVAGAGGPVNLLVSVKPVGECRNGADDDEDGLIDYPSDPGCISADDRDEDDNGSVPVCANQTDDDGDGAVDFPDDPGCLAASFESEEDVCGAGVRVTEFPHGAASIMGSTGDLLASNVLDSAEVTCGTRTHAERVFYYRNPYPSNLTLRTDYAETEILTAVYLRSTCTTANSEFGCDATSGSIAGRSRLILDDVPAGEYFIVVDTASGDPGVFKLGVESVRNQAECEDGIDNDEDGSIDDDDVGCASTQDRSERNLSSIPQCNNGVDDDFDDKIDYPFDPGCSTRGDVNETDPATVPACFNGLDDDGDGLADIPLDPGCTARGDNDETDLEIAPACANERDDDGDGFRDFPDDPGCDFAGDRTEE